MLKIDLTGQKFGMLTAIRQEKITNQGVYWLFKCDCGNETINLAKHRNRSLSCGCYKSKVHSERMKRIHTTHGMTNTREFMSWKAMRERCNNPKNTKYKFYGEKGVVVCERWQKFENFYADMGKRPDNMTLDRIDPTGDYEPSNCRWATHLEQRHNRRDSLKVK